MEFKTVATSVLCAIYFLDSLLCKLAVVFTRGALQIRERLYLPDIRFTL